MFNASGHLKTELESRAAYKTQSRAAKTAKTNTSTNQKKTPHELDCIGKGDIVELKSLASPPQGVKDTMFAVIAVLGRRQPGANEWQVCKKNLADTKFLETLKNFDPKTVTPENAKYARKMLANHSPEAIRAKSAAAFSLARWVTGVLDLQAA